MTTRSIAVATFIGVSSCGVLAQPAATVPAFEVSTIKPASPDANGRSFRLVGARRFTANNHTLKENIGFAYNLAPGLISGGPAWADSERYDIVGETPGESRLDNEQIRLMFRTLLADRFKLKFHREQKELSAYNLVLGKSAPKLKESTAGPDKEPSLLIHGSPPGGAVLPARNGTMAMFASLLQRVVMDRPVVDKTGLTGRYDFDLEFAVDGTRLGGTDPPLGGADSENKPDIFTAIQKLGLRLESTKALVEVLVIDHAEKPDGN
jgi:uncharacterized protein (TIGR03435 family)